MKKSYFILTLFTFPVFSIPATAQDFLYGDPLPDAPELSARGKYSVGVRTLDFLNNLPPCNQNPL